MSEYRQGVPRRTATTANAILGLLALRREWSTWELTKQLRRNMRFFWPRAESQIYEEAKGLVTKMTDDLLWLSFVTANYIKETGDASVLDDRAPFLDQLANKAYEMVLENAFDRGDEADADKASVEYTQKAGYASGTLADFLTRLDDRNKDQPARNGLFASHPATRDRIEKLEQ